jgi:peptidoglycan/LPS O-acetylase OafA/YrhL
MIGSIQMMRGIAALLVAIYHLSRLYQQNFNIFPFSRITEVGHIGVDFFFILSGFIIYYMHNGEINKLNCVIPYIKKRFARIYPFFWFVILLNLLLIPFVASKDFPSIQHILINLSLIPYEKKFFVLGISWTLQHEVLFYALFSTLLLNKKLGQVTLITWLSLVLINNFYTPLMFDIPVIFSAFNIQFFFGICVAYLYTKNKLPLSSFFFPCAVLFLIAIIYFDLSGVLNGYQKWGRVSYGLAFSLILAGGLVEEKRLFARIPKLFLKLGSSSYSIYLLHLFFGGIVFKAFSVIALHALLPIFVSAILTISITVYLSHLTSQFVEIPISKFVRNSLLKKPLSK